MKVSSDTYCNLPEIISEKIKVNIERNPPPSYFKHLVFIRVELNPERKSQQIQVTHTRDEVWDSYPRELYSSLL